jgi:hypothetical protein
MNGNLPIHSIHPSTWSWIIYVWIAFVLASFLRPAWKSFQRTRAAAWSLTMGTIESTATNGRGFFAGSKARFVAQIRYRYFAAGTQGEGIYERECYTEREAHELLRGLEGRPVDVRYNPSNPAQSAILDRDMEAALGRRAPGPDDMALPQSSWSPAVLGPLAALACMGLVLSLWVHIGALFGRRVAPEALFFGLHVFAILIWFPAILLARDLVGATARRDFWKALLAGSPAWLRYLVYGFFAYDSVLVEQAAEKLAHGVAKMGNHPPVAKAALIMSDLTARINSCPFKASAAAAADLSQPVKAGR